MRKPPRVTDQQMREARDRIHHRHAGDDHPDTYLLSEDPLEVLSYLRKHGTHGLREDAERHDVEDALTLRLWLWWQGEALELWLLDQVDVLALNRRRIGAVLGVRTSQGLVDRREYKRGLFPATSGGVGTRPVAAPTARQRWLDTHRRRIYDLAATLVEHWDAAAGDDEVDEWLPEVRADLKSGACTPGSFTIIGLAVDAMAAVPAVGELPEGHPLRSAIRQWPALAAELPPDGA